MPNSRGMGIGGLVLVGLLFAVLPLPSVADEIHGCGGFVEASSSLIKSRKASDTKLDYSQIRVELCTLDGLVKEWTQCAPNGYYFIPVYDKGSFLLRVKGPDGWSLKPDNVPVTVNQDGCNSNIDINFIFTGFTLSGRVKGAVGGESCSMKDGGPSDVKVDLLSLSDESIASSLTSESGLYSFINILPGKYKLGASHPNLDIEVRGTPEVNLGFGNAVVDDVFFVHGYDLHGFVVAQGNPIVGVHIFLYSTDVVDVYCPQGPGNGPGQQTALCHAISDAEGKFVFKSLPCGVYELLPYYKGENTIFDVSPSSMVVPIEHHHVKVSQKFQVTGFSIGGRVIDGLDIGVESAQILVDGQLRTITDSQGYYKLDQVTSKRYSISALKDHYKFNKLENYMVLPNMAKIDDIKANSYDVCGIVRTISSNSKAMVTLTHGPENVKPQKKLISENGSFCFEVPPGEYRLSALAVDPDNSGLMFSPSYIDINVDRPFLNVEFLQAQVNIRGKVLCKGHCSENISVSLVSIIGDKMKERKTTVLNHETCDFTFTKVFPGNYQLEVKHVPLLGLPEEDTWCWNENLIHLKVGTEDVNGVVFVQRGYWTTLGSSHDTDAYILMPDSSRLDFKIKRGMQKICMETPGLHEIYLVNSCISFGISPLKFNSLDPTPIYLAGKQYLLKGEIHIDSDSIEGAADLSEHIILNVLKKDGTSDIVHTKLSSDKSVEKGAAVYEYSFWSDLGEELIFSPQDIRTEQEKKILFYPRQRQVSVAIDGCQSRIPPIAGRVGLYFEGSVSPALDGVSIRVIAMGTSNYVSLQKGDLAFETETGADGSFTAGPLYDDISYNVEASKPSYHLKQVAPTSFTCEKLGQIVVRISGEKEDGEFLPSVLLSLSGEDGYRNNSVSSPGGTFSFIDLFPGSFYLRPVLKEYSFSPLALAIELFYGESKVVHFVARRVAYSAMGKVSLLSGQPKEDVYVEARSEAKGYYEEATTDNLGNFRLRGLLPDTTYIVKVVAKDYLGANALERASPETVAVEIGREDIRGLDFVVFEQPDITILSGHVEGDNIKVLQPHLSVEIRSDTDPTMEIRSDTDPTKIESIFPLPLSCYFEVRDLPKGKHLVQLSSRLPSNSHRFISEALEVDLEKQPQIHAGPLRYEIKEVGHKLEPTPAPLFPLIVGVSVIALFISIPRLKDLYQIIEGIIPLASNAPSIKKEVRKPILKKRIH